MAVIFPLPPRGKRGFALIAAATLCALTAIVGGRWDPATTHATRGRGDRVVAARTTRPPLPEPQRLKPLSAAEARAENAAIPLVPNGIERASPFLLADDPAFPLGRNSALDCLTAAIYYEATGEGETGQKAVAQVVLNRVRHPAFPASICGVVYQGAERATGCQFTFTCDGSLMRSPPRPAWDRARRVALAALSGGVEPSVGMATHYHARWVVPYWADGLDKIAEVGGHIFYRWKGAWGHRPAFVQRYAGEERGRGEAVADEPAYSMPDLLAPVAGPPAALANAGRRLLADELAAQPIASAPTSPLAADERNLGLVADDRPGRLKADESAAGF